jgi:hypothetical protein
VVQIGFFLHWSIDSVLDLEHPARNRVLNEISKINVLISGVGVQE